LYCGAVLPRTVSRTTRTALRYDNAATAHELPQITVIANSPLSGLGLPLNYVTWNVQSADSRI